MSLMISDIADLIEELARERAGIDDPGRRVYAVLRELAAEIGRRMARIRAEQRDNREKAKKAAA